MKNKTHTATVLSAVMAAGFLATAMPARGAETAQSHDDSKSWRTESLPTDRTLGHVERANKLIGAEVLTSDHQRFGKIDNIIVDLSTGRILYAVIGSGGILGAGEHRVAVPPMVFTQVPPDSSGIQLSVDKEKLMNAPPFTAESNKETELGNIQFVQQVYQYFGQKAWWHGGTASNTGVFANVQKADDLVGMKVENMNNEKVAKIDNIALDLPTGRVVYVILAPDTILNLGDEFYAVPPQTLTWNATQRTMVSDLNKDKLVAAPHFARNDWAGLSNPAWASQVYKYYGKKPYFEKGLEPTGR